MANLPKTYTGQEILNKVFTGSSLIAVSTDTPTASATAGGKMSVQYTEQGVMNKVVDTTNWLLNLS